MVFGLPTISELARILIISAFELSRWRGGRYRVYSLKRQWSLEELTVQRYDE